MTFWDSYFDLCEEWGLPLARLMGWPDFLTHRQWVAWTERRRRRWNEPDRTDHYLMQIGAEVRATRGMFARNPPSIRLDDLRIPFSFKVDREPTPEEVREASERAKGIWLGIASASKGGGRVEPERRTRPRREDEFLESD